MPDNLLLRGLQRLEQTVNPLRLLASGDPVALARFERETGWLVAGAVADLVVAVGPLITSVESVAAQARALEGGGLPDLAALAELGGAVADLLVALEDTVGGAIGLAEPELRAAFVADLRDLLLVNDLQRRSPALFAVLSALGLVERVVVPARFTRGGRLARRGVARLALFPERIGALLADPRAYLRSIYVPAGAQFDDEAARRFLCKLCEQLDPLARLAGARLDNHSTPLPASLVPDLALLLGRALSPAQREAHARLLRSATLAWHLPGPVDGQLGARVEVLPAGMKGASGLVGPGLDLALTGGVAYERAEGRWSVGVEVSAEVEVLGVGPKGVRFGKTAPTFAPRVEVGLRGPFVVGGSVGPRLELGGVRGHVFATLGAKDELDVGFGLVLDELAFVVSPGEGDAFLAKLLPKLDLRLSAELAWSLKGGLRLAAEAGLTARIPIRLRLGPILEVPYLDLAVAAAGAALDVSVRGLVMSKLGPISLDVEGLGLTAAIDLGRPRPAAKMRPLPPREIALSLVIPDVVTALGMLVLDIPAGRYGGAVAIATPWFEAAAIGVITTRNPWSFFISMGASFTPAIQLGYGFMLSGVGGLFAVNRELDPPGLVAALRAGALRAVLFPRVSEVLERMDEILGLVEQIFPIKQGSFVFGPMLMIDWGPGPVVRAVLGIVVSLPSPLRIALVGQFTVKLPPMKDGGGDDEEEVKPLLVLNMDVLGILDLGTRVFSIDGRLYDSFILQKFKLSGDMAFRLYFGDRPGFLLSVGGFHPSFEPPADLGALERMTMSFEKLKDDEHPEKGSIAGLAFKSYFALTSNTVQMGARFEFWVHVLGLSIDGGAGFNAIIWFKPFRLEFDTQLEVSVRRGERRLMGVALDLHVAGPKPWHFWGYARFDFFGLEIEASFDITMKLGSGDVGVLDTVGVAELMRARVADGRAWSARPGKLQSLGLRAHDDARVVRVAPDQGLEFHAQIAPLERKIDRFGADVPRMPADRGPFSVPSVTLASAGATIAVKPTTELEWFPPARFEALGHEAALKRPSFERMKGIIVVNSPPVRSVDPVVVDVKSWSDTISEPDEQGGFRLVRLAG